MRTLTALITVAYLAPAIAAAATGQAVEPWWNEQQAGLAGGIGGSLAGVLGGVIGTLAGVGKARRLVLCLMMAGITTGIVCLVAGLAAALTRQPYAVYYPLLLPGLILPVVLGALLPPIRRRYAEIELRKMESMDA